MQSDIEQQRKFADFAVRVTRIWKPSIFVSELVEEGMDHGVNSRQSLSRSVLEQFGDEVDGARICLAEHLDNSE